MCDKYALSLQIDRIQAHWPSMPKASTRAFDGYYDVLHGYSDAEVTAAVSLLLREYEGAAHPKPATVLGFARRVSQRVSPQESAQADGVYCPICGTTELVEVHAEAADTTLWSRIKRAFFEALGLVNPTQPYLVLPSRLHPRCRPTCLRVERAA